MPGPSKGDGITIGRVAIETGLTTSAIRYYERVGLLPAAPRRAGQRRYGPDAVRLLTTLRYAQRAGFTLDEIRTLFHGFGAHVPPAERWRVLAARKLAELQDLILSAQQMQRALEVGMRCGCVRIEDCVMTDSGCNLPEPVTLTRKPPAALTSR